MNFLQNFPFFSIILPMFAGIISLALKRKPAFFVTMSVITIDIVLSGFVLYDRLLACESFTYWMGHFPAPWGNEIRAGVLEGFIAFCFCLILAASLLGGISYLDGHVEGSKQHLFFIMIDLLLSSLLALIYTNDLFTAYVFIEINTIAACGLIMSRQTGHTIEAAVRYMIMSLLGSGLFLIGLAMLYDVTGHLLMPNIQASIKEIVRQGTYVEPLLVIIAFIFVGLGMKSALYPFHSWLPDAYSYSTVSSSAILSSLVSKGYIFLLIKIFYRVIGVESIRNSGILNILYLFGLAGMIMGSIGALKEGEIRRMISYSSVAQIGYIYMGIGLGTQAGVTASLFHIVSHGVTKSLLFLSAAQLSKVSGGSKKFADLTGSAYRSPLAGLAFTVGSLSMVGILMLAGFISKLLFATASIESGGKMLPTLIVLAISTVLNTVYFLKTVIRIYTPDKTKSNNPDGYRRPNTFAFAAVALIAAIFVLGMFSQPIVDMIELGLSMFS